MQQSLMSTIIGLAQDFVGSNNLNILLPIGQFGTRLHGGKDAASARYIFTMLRYACLQRCLPLCVTPSVMGVVFRGALCSGESCVLWWW